MEEITLTTLDHLTLRAKQIKEIYDDFKAMGEFGVTVCTLAGDCTGGITSLHVCSETLMRLSTLANQRIVFYPRDDMKYPASGSFHYSGVKFFALFTTEEMEAYHAENS